MSKHTNPFKRRIHVKGIVGIIGAMFAVTAGLGSIALAQNGANDPTQDTTPAVSRAFQADDTQAQAAAATPTATLGLYKANADGTLTDEDNPAKITSESTTADAARVTVTLTDEAFLSDADKGETDATKVFDKDTGKYVGTRKDDEALALKVSIMPSGISDTELSFKYGDFTQAKDQDGNAIAGTYEVKPADGQVLRFANSGTSYGFSVLRYAGAAYDKDAPQVDLQTGLNGNDITYDTTKPAVSSTAKFDDGHQWLKGTAEAGNATTWFTTTAPTIDFGTRDAGTKMVIHIPGADPEDTTLNADTSTWTMPEGKIDDLSAVTVTTIRTVGEDEVKSDPVTLKNLLAAGGTTQDPVDVTTIIVDPNAGNLTLGLKNAKPENGAQANNTTYYQSVDGFTVSSASPHFADELALLKANGINLLTINGQTPTTACAADSTLSADGKTVDCGTAGLDFTDGAQISVQLNDKLPGVDANDLQTKTFTIDSTAPTITGISYDLNGGQDDRGDGLIVTKGDNTTRLIRVTVKDLLPGHSEDQADDDKGKVSGVTEVWYQEEGSDPKNAVYDTATGTATITLDQRNHTYNLTTLKVWAKDRAGNSTDQNGTTVSKLASSLDSNLKDINSITISDPDADKNITTTIVVSRDGKDVKSGTYLSLKEGDALPTVQLKVKGNALFGLRWKIAQALYADVNAATSTLAGEDGNAKANGSAKIDSYTDAGDGSYLINLNGKLLSKENGLYTLTANTQGLPSLLGSKDAQQISIGMDDQQPSVTKLAYNGDPSDLKDNATAPNQIIASGPRTITFAVHDLFTAKNANNEAKGDSNNVAGLNPDSVKVFARIADLQTGKPGEEKQLETKRNDDGTYVVTFKDEGLYKLENIRIEASDKAAPANMLNVKLSDLKDPLDSQSLPNTLAVYDGKDVKTSIVVNGPSSERDGKRYYTKVDSIALKVEGDKLFTMRADILSSDLHKDTAVFDGSNVTYAKEPKGVGISGLTFANAAIDRGAGTITWTGDALAKLIKPVDGTQTNGNYVLRTSLVKGAVTLLPAPGESAFTLDSIKPEVTRLEAATGTKGQNLLEGYALKDGKANLYAAAGEQKLTVTVKDLLPVSQRADGDRANGLKNELGTSGIDDGTVTYSIPAPVDLDGKVIGDAVKDHRADDFNADAGTFTITLGQEGLYRLSGITVSVKDVAGNTLSGYKLGDVKSADRSGANYAAIIADTKDDDGVALRVDKADGVPDSSDGNNYYFRGNVKATYTITDKWFPVVQALDRGKKPGLLGGSWANVDPLHGNARQNIAGLAANARGWNRNGNTYSWTLSNQPVLIAGQNHQIEGEYNLNLVYSGLRPEEHNTSKKFVMDWTAPRLGDLTVNQRGPVRWNWLFSPGSFTATLGGISDNVSGVVPGSTRFSSQHFDNWLSGKNDPAPVYAGDNKGGSISFTMDGDSQRLFLDGTSIALVDAAGNPVDTGALAAYEGVNGNKAGNMVKGLAGVVIDTVAPTLSISYDNNDVRNGKYYKAYRTGTVTLVDSNFDFSKANEADRVIVTDTVDGQRRTLPVSAFSNPSGDRRTYVASFPANLDGDWVIDASYTDPADHASNTIHEEWTVDTIAPQLTLTFDNNDVRNGMYYNADRIATVSQVERNFSDGESVVITTAADDNGSSSPAPSGSGWAYTGGTREASTHTSTVLFSGEYHYTIRATATDLAGNVATEVSEPEFVIDKTKPTIKIDRVEDKTAYAGEVAPLIDYDDTNIDKSTIEYTLEGAHRGELKDKDMPASTGTDTANARTVDFADFERKPEMDDVYTLKAKAQDLAGNEYEVEKTFSANRFGSTYTFNAGTQNLRGAYIKKSQDVKVTEINVSGLDQGKSEVVVAKNDKATTLARDSYTVKSGDDKGWSSTIYTIPASNFADDGYYRVQLQSVDNAGNLSQNTMENKDADRKSSAEVNFALDTTAPTSSLLNVQSGSVYYDQAGLDMAVNAKDNLGIERSDVYLDGILAKTWTGEELLTSTPQYVVAADDNAHRIVVRTVDLAGNEATATYDNVYVASSWWQYATHTPWILNTMIFAALILAALLIALLLMLRRRHMRNAYRRNPFDVPVGGAAPVVAAPAPIASGTVAQPQVSQTGAGAQADEGKPGAKPGAGKPGKAAGKAKGWKGLKGLGRKK